MSESSKDSPAKQRAHADRIGLERHIADRLGLSRTEAREMVSGMQRLAEFQKRVSVSNDPHKPFKVEGDEAQMGRPGDGVGVGNNGGGADNQGTQPVANGVLTNIIIVFNGTAYYTDIHTTGRLDPVADDLAYE